MARLCLVPTNVGICLKYIREDGKELSASFEMQQPYGTHRSLAFELTEVCIFGSTSSHIVEERLFFTEREFVTFLKEFAIDRLPKK